MKTLKELYEIVKAAGGDFPFEVENPDYCVKKAIFVSMHNEKIWIEWQGNYSETEFRTDIFIGPEQDSERWQFPADTPYQAVDPVAYTISKNRQRWEDMGRPWGRLKGGATFLWKSPATGTVEEFKFNVYQDAYAVIVVWGKNKKDYRITCLPADCELTDKTFLNLDDWLLPAQDDEPVCKFCKGKKELTWVANVKVDSDCIHVNRTAKNMTLSMPCPHCNPGAFE